MSSAQNKLYKPHVIRAKIATLVMGVAFLLLSVNTVLAADTTIGEYLYNDDYTIDTGASCTLNVKNSDGTALITDQVISSTADGWYGYTFSSPTTTGYYRSEMCCDTNGDHLCIDKSFEINEAVDSSPSTNDISSAVWGYSGRTLTGFNNIVADVWSYATRKLTSGENIVTTVTSTNIENIKTTSNETRLILEQLVNKPIIENSLEEVQDIDLSEKIQTSKTVANELYINLLFLDTTIDKTNKDWVKLTDREILDNLSEAKDIIGDESDSTSSNSFFGKINFLRDTWGLKEGDELHEEIKAINNSLGFVQSGIASYGKSNALLKELRGSSVYLTTSEKILSLINKKISENEANSLLIENNLIASNNILNSWNSNSYLDVKNKVDDLILDVLAINKVPKGKLVIESSFNNISHDKKLKNKVLGLRALLFANKKLMINGSKTVLIANWLEEGSLVIKTLITNPSILISQEVPLKYYLPKEVKKEHIIETDAGAEVKYDTERDQLYVEGNFTLKPGETRTVKVRVEDVWQISETEIDNLLKQTDDLVKPLEKTAYFAQGITLKSNIGVSLNKAKDLLKDGVTPEAKIKAYREAELEINSVKEQVEKLKELVSLASSSGSILGFVGGSQAIAVWGIVITIATGFVFMTVYMRKLLGKETAKEVVLHSKKKHLYDKLAVFLVVSTISGLLSSIGVKKLVLPVYASQNKEVLGTATIDYKAIKIVKLVSLSGVVKTYQNVVDETVLEIIDSGKSAIEIERAGDRVKVVYDQKEAYVDLQNVLSE